MGLAFSQAKFLLDAKKHGVTFDNTATLGKLTSYLTEHDLEIYQHLYNLGSLSQRPEFGKTTCDIFFAEWLQTKTLLSIDHSSYEGATFVHDMNAPIAPSHHECFDVVIDSGTLEHVFNFPVAIENAMNLLKIGGCIFINTPTNNHCGHGFYQFSPELMFRIFQPENGFKIVYVIFESHQYPGGELSSEHQYYIVTDPAMVRSRVSLVSKKPTMMHVCAVKTEHLPLFANPPYQSDYVLQWNSDNVPFTHPKRPTYKYLLDRVPNAILKPLRNRVNGYRQLRSSSVNNRKLYERINIKEFDPFEQLGI